MESKPVLPDLTSLVPFNREEADTRVVLHASLHLTQRSMDTMQYSFGL